MQKHCESHVKILNGEVEVASPTDEEKPLALDLADGAEDSSTKQTAVVTISVEESLGDEKESVEKGEEQPIEATPLLDDDEVVKSKVTPPASEATDKGAPLADDQSESVQPKRKQNVHITSLSILSPRPPKEEAPSISTAAAAASISISTSATTTTKQASSSPSAKQSTSSTTKQAAPSPSPTLPLVISPALITAVSLTERDSCTPSLLVYSIKSNRPLDKGKSDQKVKPPLPPPPDPLDYDPWEPIELAPSYMPTSSSTSSVLDVLSETKPDANTSPADLKYLHSIPLNEFSCGADSGNMSEVTDILPLARGQLLAVLCNISSASPLLTSSLDDEGKEGERDSSQSGESSNHGGLLLFRTTIEEDGDRMRLRVDEEPVKVIRFADHSSTVVSMCVITSESKLAERKEERQPAVSRDEEEKETDILLGTVTRGGDVTVYECSSFDMNAIGHYSCRSDLTSHDLQSESCDLKPAEFTGCTYCPPSYHLAVADSNGHVTLLSVRELFLTREKLATKGEEEEENVVESQGKRNLDG